MRTDTPSVPLFDLTRQWHEIEGDVHAAVERVFATQQFILGPEVAAFENECAAYLGVKRAIGVTSGTDALLASLMCLDIGPGDEVVTTPFTFFASAGVIWRLRARPVFVDIDPRDFNLDPEALRAAITPRTKAVIPIHLFGQACDFDAVKAAAGDLPIVEDCCQSIGTAYKGKATGGLGTFGCFSFFPTKNLGAFGDGGLVTTNDEALGERMVDMRVHGMRRRYEHHFVGGNFRLAALQAAILRVKLPRLDGWIAKRRAGAAHYRQLLTEAGLLGYVRPPEELADRGHTYHQYVVRAERRDALREHLTKRGLGTEVYYPIPLHLQTCFAELGYGPGSFPVSEQASREVLALPIFPEARPDERERVVEAMRTFYCR
ncbi:MAG: DegT/DnrJ/EryC1/StrS family aminotransferase [Thermoanaerobaculaceae bacterium]|nr:DegT/DnrJ/EryC1/StrS family aminotransferase [Thermoanaerobaculaceae bacterium]MDI9623151.1 DegT/DnrJ/EryC1/StrS family aminotransferase [Acidobacteriota bacterium]NLH09976.1 DegT/DnrJ/EryC1/StrS family aminotransferase [Holophagae bacterium]HPW54535.1 DegT/DnrJ/EryC1/StrS family aminotransferase [Thermoanaerobaculaceae bacterium]